MTENILKFDLAYYSLTEYVEQVQLFFTFPNAKKVAEFLTLIGGRPYMYVLVQSLFYNAE